MSTAVPTTDPTAALPPVALDTASRWINNIRYTRDLTLYKAERAQYRHTRALALPAIAGFLTVIGTALIGINL